MPRRRQRMLRQERRAAACPKKALVRQADRQEQAPGFRLAQVLVQSLVQASAPRLEPKHRSEKEPRREPGPKKKCRQLSSKQARQKYPAKVRILESKKLSQALTKRSNQGCSKQKMRRQSRVSMSQL